MNILPPNYLNLEHINYDTAALVALENENLGIARMLIKKMTFDKDESMIVSGINSETGIFNLLDAAADKKYGEIIDLLLEKRNVAEYLTKKMAKDLLKEAAPAENKETVLILSPASTQILENILSVQHENYEECESSEDENEGYDSEEETIPSTIPINFNTEDTTDSLSKLATSSSPKTLKDGSR